MSGWQPIDGETPIDISGLKIRATNRRELSVAEADNITRAVFKYLGKPVTRRTAKFDDAWALKLHREMFGEVWQWAGQIRQQDLNIGIAWHQVSTELLQLFDDLACWDTTWPDRVEQAARLHHRAVEIHPFENGNGRWARMLANVWLHLKKHPIVDWPGDLGETSPIRAEYLRAVKQADDGVFGPFLEMHRRLASSPGGRPPAK